jgi:hypothetical protein
MLFLPVPGVQKLMSPPEERGLNSPELQSPAMCLNEVQIDLGLLRRVGNAPARSRMHLRVASMAARACCRRRRDARVGAR